MSEGKSILPPNFYRNRPVVENASTEDSGVPMDLEAERAARKDRLSRHTGPQGPGTNIKNSSDPMVTSGGNAKNPDLLHHQRPGDPGTRRVPDSIGVVADHTMIPIKKTNS